MGSAMNEHNGNGNGDHRATMTNEAPTPRPPRPEPEDMGPEPVLPDDTAGMLRYAIRQGAAMAANAERDREALEEKIADAAQRVTERLNLYTESRVRADRAAAEVARLQVMSLDRMANSIKDGFEAAGRTHNALAFDVGTMKKVQAEMRAAQEKSDKIVGSMLGHVGELFKDYTNRMRAPAIAGVGGGVALAVAVEVIKFLSSKF